MIYMFLYNNAKDLCNDSELTLDFEIAIAALLYSLFEDEDLVLIDPPLPKYRCHFFVLCCRTMLSDFFEHFLRYGKYRNEGQKGAKNYSP